MITVLNQSQVIPLHFLNGGTFQILSVMSSKLMTEEKCIHFYLRFLDIYSFHRRNHVGDSQTVLKNTVPSGFHV